MWKIVERADASVLYKYIDELQFTFGNDWGVTYIQWLTTILAVME